jgi:beta-glucosidase
MTMAEDAVRFPQGFAWGAATAAYQVEGAVTADGRGPSIWDTFCARPGAIAGGDTGDVACDHYHRYPQDIDAMAELGLGAYRFSVAWPRIQPDGAGAVNQKGLDHYRRVVDRLLERGIEPYVTLYHWDLPQALQDRGGWPERDTAYRFADYAGIVHAALGDVVRHWITLNEPKVSSHAGYGEGIHAPGIRDLAQRDRAVHHLLLAHGLGLRALRAAARPDERFGITLDLSPVDPATDSAADVAAARRLDADDHLQFLEPVLGGGYPPEAIGPAAAARDGDLDLIGAPIDFLGVNYYRRIRIKAGADGPLHAALVIPDDVPVTAVGWPVQPGGLRDVLVSLRDAHPNLPPVYVTENGAAYPDEVSPDGVVDDPPRVDYLHRHLLAMHEAIAAGVDVRGYFAWSLMDNFEWAEGFAKRFGLFYVDYADQRRIPKTSAGWYGRVARGNMVPAG